MSFRGFPGTQGLFIAFVNTQFLQKPKEIGQGFEPLPRKSFPNPETPAPNPQPFAGPG